MCLIRSSQLSKFDYSLTIKLPAVPMGGRVASMNSNVTDVIGVDQQMAVQMQSCREAYTLYSSTDEVKSAIRSDILSPQHHSSSTRSMRNGAVPVAHKPSFRNAFVPFVRLRNATTWNNGRVYGVSRLFALMKCTAACVSLPTRASALTHTLRS